MPIGSSQEEKKIKFSADGSDLNSFMKKLMTDQKSLYAEFSKNAKSQTDNQKEQLKLIESQIKALERKSKLEKEILRDQVRSLREYGGEKEQGRADTLEQQIKDRRYSDKNKVSSLKDMLADDKGKLSSDKPSVGSQVFGATMLANLLKDALGLVRQGANAQTGLDLLTPFTSIAGGITGGLVGSAIDAAEGSKILGTGFGQTNFGLIGAQTGKEIGGLAGDLVTRHFKTKEAYDNAAFGYTAISGQQAKFNNMAGAGYDDITVAQAMQKIARARGGSGSGVENVLGLSRGFGVEESATLGAIGLQRSGTGGLQNSQRGLGIALAEGINRSKLTDVITTQTAILQEFAKTNANASTTQGNRTLFELNRMGGGFSIGNPLMQGNFQALQEGLSNPGNSFGQAQNYSVLRRLNSNASVWQLRKMQQQGLQTPGFLSAVLNDISASGGSEDFQKFQAQGRFGNLSMDTIDTLFKNKGQLGSMSQSELNKILGSSAIQSEASSMTSQLTKDTAEVSNAFKTGFMDGIYAVEKQFENRMKQAVDEVANYLESKFNGSSSHGHTGTQYDSKGRALAGSDYSKKPLIRGDQTARQPTKSELSTVRGMQIN